jgi:hypothetical protein
MTPDSAAVPESEREVMAAVEDDRLVIADICRDGAWVTMPLAEAATLSDYR